MSIRVGLVTIDGSEFSRPWPAGGRLVVPFVGDNEPSVREALRIIKATPEEIEEMLDLLGFSNVDL